MPRGQHPVFLSARHMRNLRFVDLIPGRLLLIILSVYCSTGLVIAHDVHGKVVDEQDMPVVGAYIIHLPSENHAHTNELGAFSLNGVDPGDTLLVMHIGFENTKYVVEDLSHDVRIVIKAKTFQLDEVVVGQTRGSADLISKIDVIARPVSSSQDLLQQVPGLFIAQHGGGGKAEQIFLRGFDIDHGTDVQITADGMPVNMVSHAHGQGYADLHFIIPEAVESIDYGKGPYNADKGNFATAGYVEYKMKERVDRSVFGIEAGSFNTFRISGLVNVMAKDSQSAYVASEYIFTNGPFDVPQNLNRINVMGKYTVRLPRQNKLSLTASHFSSDWDQSGQIPTRSVESGMISRFGAIDSTEGGSTNRTNVALQLRKVFNPNTFIKHNLYFSKYNFELFSNFTFYLNDPDNGDQIVQREGRQIFGAESEINHAFNTGNATSLVRGGIGVRYDDIDNVELSSTASRRYTGRYSQIGDIDETNLYGFCAVDFAIGDLTVSPGLRLDYFRFSYIDQLDSTYSRKSAANGFAGPKLNLVYNATDELQLYAKSGIGFHSNDARVILVEQNETLLPAVFGADMGALWKPVPKLVLGGAAWWLHSQQEFVYVGDEGIVEPGGRTRRLGVDLSVRYQLADWLMLDSDVTYSYARSLDEPEGQQYIPLAPVWTWSGGAEFSRNGLVAGLRWRYLGDRPATEDNNLTAKGYFIVDANISYRIKNLTFGLIAWNLFDVDWEEAQFATESRLKNETSSVTEINFTPGSPVFFKGLVQYSF